MAILIPAAGTDGSAACSPFAQMVLCGGGAVLFACACLSKLLHKPKRREVHYLKAAMHAAGGVIALTPLLLPSIRDIFALAIVVGGSMMVNVAQLVITRTHEQTIESREPNPAGQPGINPQHKLLKSTPLL